MEKLNHTAFHWLDHWYWFQKKVLLWWAWCENSRSERNRCIWDFISFLVLDIPFPFFLFFFFCNWHVCACSCEVHAWRRNETEQVPLSFPLANYSVFLLLGGGVPVPPLPIHWYYIMAAGGALLLLAVAILVRALCCCRQHLATKKSQLSVAYHSSSQCFQYSNWSSSMATPGVEPVLTVRLDSRDRHRTLCWKQALSVAARLDLVYSRKSDDDTGTRPEKWQFAKTVSSSIFAAIGCCFSIPAPLKEFVVDISHYAAPQQRTWGLSKLFIWTARFEPLSAVWLLVMPTVLPKWPRRGQNTQACVGWKELPARAAKPQTKNKTLETCGALQRWERRKLLGFEAFMIWQAPENKALL